MERKKNMMMGLYALNDGNHSWVAIDVLDVFERDEKKEENGIREG